MKIYLMSLAAGLLVGVIYSLINVRSPAPPVVALVGLLGILAGEQIIPVGKQLLGRHPPGCCLAAVAVHTAPFRDDAGPPCGTGGRHVADQIAGDTVMSTKSIKPT